MKRRGLLLLALLVILFASVSPEVFAAENGNVGGTPANPNPSNPRTQSIFVYEIKPGQQVSDGVKIINNSDKQQTVTVLAVDSVLSGGGAFACRQAADPKKDVGSWISLDTNTITLDPDSSQVIPFTVTVPDSKSVDVGEHDGCITIQAASQTAKPSNKNGILLSFRSAIRVAITIPGKIVKSLSLTSVDVKSTEDGKYVVSPVALNDGNVSLDTNIQVAIQSLVGSTIATYKEGSSPVLPHAKASWNYEVKRPFWGGLYRAQVTASYNSDTKAELGIDTNPKEVSVKLTSGLFFVAPSTVGGLIELAVLAVLLIIVTYALRRYRSAKQVKRHWATVTVGASDTIQSLAKSHHISWKRIARVNKLKPPYHIEPGTKLKLPSKKS